jgi:hypothetical protein
MGTVIQRMAINTEGLLGINKYVSRLSSEGNEEKTE